MAVDECAFLSSKLPIILSMEMHCTTSQQHRVAKMLIEHVGSAVLKYDELVATGRARWLSPADLRRRVLTKGKIKTEKPRSLLAKTMAPRQSRSSSRRSSFRLMWRGNSQRQTDSRQTDTSGPVSDLERHESDSFRHTDSARFTDSFVLGQDEKHFSHPNQTLSDTTQKARRRLDKKVKPSRSIATDALYMSCLCVRSRSVASFLGEADPKSHLPVTSVNEDRLLKELGLPKAERNQIEDLLSSSDHPGGVLGVTQAQLLTVALIRLAANPPVKVGEMQRRTADYLLRPYPLGLRFSGKNMSPLPGWLSGAQNVALNMSNTDVPVQLHFALFTGSDGFRLKPPEMRATIPALASAESQCTSERDSTASQLVSNALDRVHSGISLECRETSSFVPKGADRQSSGTISSGSGHGNGNIRRIDESYWPPPRDVLHCTTIQMLSLHNLPKRGERRPRLSGSRMACHSYHPELSGTPAAPNSLAVSSPGISVTLHPIGGFCAVSTTLPLARQQSIETEFWMPATEPNGMNALFGQTIHCTAAEPHATFLRVAATDGRHEVAYETAVLGRLRRGFRVLQMRGSLGTRIELCYLLVKITFRAEANLFATPRQLRISSMQQREENLKLKAELASLTRTALANDKMRLSI